MLKAVLVDLDGTLVDSGVANATAYSLALAHWGVTVDPVAMAADIEGRSWRDFLPGLLASHPGVEPEQVSRRKRDIYPSCFHLLHLNERLVELLLLLRDRVATGLVTTASGAAVEAVFRHFRLDGLFDVVVTGDHVQRAKPFPDGYELAARHLAVGPDECLVIEDSEVGMAAARAFGAGLFRWSGPLPGQLPGPLPGPLPGLFMADPGPATRSAG